MDISNPFDPAWEPSGNPGDTEDLTQLVQDNLLEDFYYWNTSKYTVQGFFTNLNWTGGTGHEWDTVGGESSVRRVMMIKHIKAENGTILSVVVLFPRQSSNMCQTSCTDGCVCDGQLRGVFHAMQTAFPLHGIVLPESIFYINTADHALCGALNNSAKEKGGGSGAWLDCQLPIFSLCKRRHHSDILIPVFTQIFAFPSNWEWSKKIPKGFWRGAGTCGFGFEQFGCCRSQILGMGVNNTDILDAGYYTDVNYPCHVDKLLCDFRPPKLGTLPFVNFTQFKYLINPDRMVAAYRLGNLMHTNSVVLKQDSL
jgi:hypothetical protein